MCDGYYDEEVGVVDEPNMEIHFLEEVKNLKNIEIQSNLKYMDLMHYFQIRFCVLVVRKQVITSQHMKH